MRLKDRVAIITGAADGIGHATAVKFAQEGADCLLVDINEAGLLETAALVAQAGRRAVSRVEDLRAAGVPRRVVEAAVQEFGGFDILVNNAGIFAGGQFLTFTEEDLDRVLAVNVRAVFLLSQAAARWWAQQNRPGQIVNLSSITAELATKDSAAYAMSKGAVRMLTKALALDLAQFKIRVNAVGPGATRTGMNRELLEGTRIEQRWVERTPLGRIGDPEDVANAIAFLVSDEAAYITGQTLYIEGGRTIYVP